MEIKSKTTCILLLMLPLNIFFVWYWRTNSIGPYIKLESQNYDLGTVNQGDVLNFDIRFESSGRKPLRIEKVTSSCKCVVAQLDKEIYEPKENIVLSGHFKAEGSPASVIQKQICIHSNALNTPDAIVKLSAMITPSLSVAPRKIDFRRIPYLKPIDTSFVVSSLGIGDRFEIKSISSDIEGLILDISDPSMSTEEIYASNSNESREAYTYLVSAKLPPQRRIGELKGHIFISTSSELSPELIVTVEGEVMPSVTSNLNMILLPVIDKKVIQKCNLKISSEYPFILCLPKKLDISVEYSEGTATDIAQKTWSVIVDIVDISFLANTSGTLDFDLKEHPCQDRISIPYSVIIME